MLLLVSRASFAMSEDPGWPGEPQIGEALRALEAGDLRHARALAEEARAAKPHSSEVMSRVQVVRALADARDPNVGAAQLDDDLDRVSLHDLDVRVELMARIPSKRAELLAMGDSAVESSPWAAAALARVEPDPVRKGALVALCRIHEADIATGACGEHLPEPPFSIFWGEPISYVLIGALVLFFAIYIRLRRGVDRPWIGHMPRLQIGIIGASAAWAVLHAERPLPGFLLLVAAGAIALFGEPLLYLSRVRRGKLGRLSVRFAGRDETLELPTYTMVGITTDRLVLEAPLSVESPYRSSGSSAVPLAWILVRPPNVLALLFGAGFLLLFAASWWR